VKFVFFTHSLVSDWNHGNAHFQRGVMRELVARGHRAVAAERVGAWSRTNLLEEAGSAAVSDFRMRLPELVSVTYEGLEGVDALVEDADVVIVHEWTEADVVAHLGRLRVRGAAWTLLLHDTHHRAVSAPHELDAFDLDGYDGVLAFGAVLADTYRRRGWAEAVHVWHEAADARLLRPMPEIERRADLVWIGNWGDGERTAELATFLLEPVRALGLGGTVHGVRYPPEARAAVAAAGLEFGGWIANTHVPEVFARHRVTVHVPRRHYVETLPGIPTIRVFEALACGIPLVSAPWDDSEGLFRPGEDFLVARDGEGMRQTLARLLVDPDLAAAVAASGRQRVLERHTCAHRVDELLAILGDIRVPPAAAAAAVGASAA
jgi:spore maturation protein CgeB